MQWGGSLDKLSHDKHYLGETTGKVKSQDEAVDDVDRNDCFATMALQNFLMTNTISERQLEK